jgi:hypothetical protein
LASAVLVDMHILLLRGWSGLGAATGCSESARLRGKTALSSYNNNSNNPPSGTDLLRDAW